MTPAEELRTAATRLRDGSRFDGMTIDADSADLLRHIADLFRLRLPLAAWLERMASEHEALCGAADKFAATTTTTEANVATAVEVLRSGPVCLDEALTVARAINRSAP